MERTQLTRDVEAIQIPGGHTLTLEKGWDVVITQSLGGTYTVQVPAYGGLFRIAGRDADALGMEPTTAPAAAASGGLEEQVWATLKTCFDPEIPVNIVDLGLVYDLRITPEGDGQRIDVKMTLTAPGCGMGTSIAADARLKLLDLPGVSDADVQIVWDPPWNPQMISPEGKERLGMARRAGAGGGAAAAPAPAPTAGECCSAPCVRRRRRSPQQRPRRRHAAVTSPRPLRIGV